jgi:prepilin-type N-terminal cleavage/methylation domain-containing protein
MISNDSKIISKKKKGAGFTLIELLIVVAIISILAASVIMILNPGQRMEEARETTRESHMITIGNAVHLAVIDCAAGSETYCANAASVVEYCRVGGVTPADWAFKADATNCTIDSTLAPLDPLSGNPYFINNDGNHNVKVWADSSESTWYCNPDGNNQCQGATYKRF